MQSGKGSWVGRAASVVSSGLGRGYRFIVITLRWVVLVGWVAAAVALTVLIPYRPDTTTGTTFGELLPADSPVFRVEQRILQEFRVPLLSGTTVVVHQADGLSLLTRADSLLWGLATTQDTLQSDNPPKADTIAAAIPVPTGRTDVAVTYLYVAPGTGLRDEVQLADRYAAHFNNQPDVSSYVTGFVPAQIAQLNYLDARLRLFEVASVLVIMALVAFAFRSLLAPLVVVGVAAVGYLVYFPLLSSFAAALGFTVPAQLEPVLVALLLGVVTDYCVLLFSAFRDELRGGLDRKEAARAALRVNAPIIAWAGLTVAGGTIALLAAPFHVFRGLGPALALTVLVGLAVCLTLAPAVMTILGWRLFTVLPVRGSQSRNGFLRAAPRRRHLGLALLTRRASALLVVIAVGGGLALAAVPLTHARLDLSFVAALPGDDSVAEGADLLAVAGLRGISAPSEILVEKPGVVAERPELARLQMTLAQQPGVARVIGPADLPTKQPRGVLLSQSGNAARYLLIYDSDPLGAEAIGNVRQLESSLPDLVAQSGLSDAKVSVAGQTVFASTVAQLTRRSIEITVLTALVIELVILVLYLRATRRSGGAAGGQCTERRSGAGADDVPLPGRTWSRRADLLRAVRCCGAAHSAGRGLHRLLGWIDLGSGEPPATGESDHGCRAPNVASDYDGRRDLGGDVRARRDHSAGYVPSDRLCGDRRADDRHPDRTAGTDASTAHRAGPSRQLAESADHPR